MRRVFRYTLAFFVGMALMVQLPPDAADIETCNGLPVTILGTPEEDWLYGTEGPDVIVGLEGSDRIYAGGGDDFICEGPGSSDISGDDGNDVIRGGDGNDSIQGNGGNDIIYPGNTGFYLPKWEQWLKDGNLVTGDYCANQTETCVEGDDKIYGGPGDDNMTGDKGDDVLIGNEGNDNAACGQGYDRGAAETEWACEANP